MAPPRILIVDDEHSIRNLLRTYLASEGYEIKEAANGQEAIDAITCDPPPDVILLDLSIPPPQGMEVLQHLKNLAVRPPPQVIVLTANATVSRAVEAMHLGALDFLEKPCPPERLLAAIARAMEKKTFAEAAATQGHLARAGRDLGDGLSAKAEACVRAASRLADLYYLQGHWHELNDRHSDAQAAYQQAAQLDHKHGPAQEALRRLAAIPDPKNNPVKQ